MTAIELTGHVDASHHLHIEVPANIPPGPVKIVLHVIEPDDDEHSGDWQQAVAAQWSAEWNDPREDIYTLEDGEPV